MCSKIFLLTRLSSPINLAAYFGLLTLDANANQPGYLQAIRDASGRDG